MRRDGQGTRAWVGAEGRRRRQGVASAGESADGRAIVSSGLAGGEALVVGDASGLSEGQRVNASAPTQ